MWDMDLDYRPMFENGIENCDPGTALHVLFLALQAVCEQQMGMKDLAEETMQQAREGISRFFDHHSDFLIACTFTFLSYYEAGCGRVKNARYYIQSVEFYFKELEDTALSIHQVRLKQVLATAYGWIQKNDDHLELIQTWPTMLETATHQRVPHEWRSILEKDVTPSNYVTILRTVETVYDSLQEKFPKNVLAIAKPMLLSAIRIAIFARVNKGRELIEECALAITLLTENENFTMTPVTIVPHVALAAKVHLQIVKSIERGQRENPVVVRMPFSKEFELESIDYYQILMKDLRALYLLASRFKKVDVFYSGLIREIEGILQMHTGMNATTSVNQSSDGSSMDSLLLDEENWFTLPVDWLLR